MRAKPTGSALAPEILKSYVEQFPVGNSFDIRTVNLSIFSQSIDEMEADVDVKVSPVRVGTSVLPASKVHVALAPVKKDVKVLHRTRCGQPITAAYRPVSSVTV